MREDLDFTRGAFRSGTRGAATVGVEHPSIYTASMPEPLLDALRRAPHDRSTFAVWADSLAERGDPRGELAHLLLQIESAEPAERARLSARLAEGCEAHWQALWLRPFGLPLQDEFRGLSKVVAMQRIKLRKDDGGWPDRLRALVAELSHPSSVRFEHAPPFHSYDGLTSRWHFRLAEVSGEQAVDWPLQEAAHYVDRTALVSRVEHRAGRDAEVAFRFELPGSPLVAREAGALLQRVPSVLGRTFKFILVQRVPHKNGSLSQERTLKASPFEA